MKLTKEFLEEASKLIGGDRQKDYGDKVQNHTNIAKLWSAYLDVEVMGLLKVARTKLGATSKDTYIDMAAYSAIAGEIRFKDEKKNS